MALISPIIQDGILTNLQDESPIQIVVGSSDWFAWLQSATTFTFRSEEGFFTARKERAGNRRGSAYWRAYRKRDGKLHRAYLGKSEELTLERLRAVAAVLIRQEPVQDPSEASMHEPEHPPTFRRGFPTGTMTLLFTDIEGSTQLLQQVGERYANILTECRRLLRTAFMHYNGSEVDTQGDAFFVVFARATDAVSAAVTVQRALANHRWLQGVTGNVRIGLHTGEPQVSSEGYVGLDVHYAARIMQAGHGGQVLLSQTTRDLVAHDLPEGMCLRDLGQHRLKDIERPSQLFQLDITGLPADFPPVKTLGARLNNLPAPLTPMIGREQEVAAALTLLRRPEVRLLSLVGTAGVGKTRLALQVATDLQDDFPDGVFFVTLAPVRDPELVLSTVALTLSLRATGEQTFLEVLSTSLREKHCLLVLDNFEQVASAASHISDLLEACPHIKLLITSREILHLRAEHQFSVPPLALPDRKQQLPGEQALARIAAVELFLQRAQTIRSDFLLTPNNATAIAKLCIRLDGLPLALELAAARVKVFTPQALLARLDRKLQILTGGGPDLPERQRTLRNTIEWSYELLSVEEQRLFRRLSVFAGGATLEAIESVTSALGDDPGLALDGITSLIDKSLLPVVQQEKEEPRFVMLETIRDYGLERLDASGEMEAVRRIYAEYFVHFAEEAAQEVDGPQQAAWFDRLEQDHENIREVLRWSLEQAPAEETKQRLTIALRLASALRKFWVVRSHLAEALSFLERALVRGEEIISPSQLARALDQAGGLARFLGNQDRAEELLRESLRLRRTLADTRGIAGALHRLGQVEIARYDFPAARALTEEALSLFREQGDQIRITWGISQLAGIACEQGDYNQAYALFEECLERYRTQGNTIEVGNSLCQLGEVLFLSGGSLERAQAFFNQGLTLLREVGDEMSYTLALAGHVALLRDDLFTAELQGEESIVNARESGDPENLALALALLGRIKMVQGDFVAASAYYQESLTIASQRRLKGALIVGIEGLAQVFVMQRAFAWAARLWGAAEALREAAGTPLPPVSRHEYQQSIAVAHSQLGKQSFLAAWAEGRSMIPEHILLSMDTMLATQAALPPPTSAEIAPSFHADLNPREMEVLRLLAQGLTSAQIAEQLVIGLVTVNSHVRSIYSKLGVTSRSAVTRYAIEHHLV